MKTIVFVTDGTEEIEAITIIDVLRRAGIEVEAVGIKDEKKYLGAHNIWSSADCLIQDVQGQMDQIEAIIVPGGYDGTMGLAGDQRVLDLVKEGREAGKLIGAICAGPVVLEKAGIMEGVDFTCFPGFEDEISGNFKDENVVFDQNIMTSRGPATAMAFAIELVGQLRGQEGKEELEEDLLIKYL